MTDSYIVAIFLDTLDMDGPTSRPANVPVFSLMTEAAKEKWLLDAACQLVQKLELCTVNTLDSIRDNLMSQSHDDFQLEIMKNGEEYICVMCNKRYRKLNWFKKHLVKKHKWEFHKSKSSETSSDPVKLFLTMSLLYRDTCDSYAMGDGDRIVRNAFLEWLFASGMKHTKYKIWLWRMISYVISVLSPKDSFEYKWNMTVNLNGGIGNSIPNDNCVEIQVHKIKSQLNTQGANKSYESAKVITRTTQIIESIKHQLMKTTKTAKSKNTRPAVDRTGDINTMVSCLRKHGPVADLKWESFKHFKNPLSRICSSELHEWIRTQQKIASIYM